MLVIVVIVIGLRKNKKMLIYLAIGLLYLFSTPFFSNNFFKLLEGNEYSKPISAIDNADAIVVLSGIVGIKEVGEDTYIEWGDADRFFGGIALFKAGKAQSLVFTKGKMPWDRMKNTEGDILKKYAVENNIPNEKILLTSFVENTEEEAKAVKELLKPRKKIILVTSAYHMYRARKLFEKEGFNVIPYKVDFKVYNNQNINIVNFFPTANSLGITETGMREIIGRIFYFMKG
jgi:uncharacterized SAM-binding protein YcdF (DUF218 family)